MIRKLLLSVLILLLPLFGFGQATKLSGNYIIGSNAGADFATITAAVNKLNTVGAKGDVYFLLDNLTYNTSTNETFPIQINSFDGNGTYKLTFKPNAGKKVTISASNAANTVEAVFKLNGVDKVIFDGSNTENGTTKDLTLYNATTSINTNNKRSVIWIASENSTNGSSNHEIKNITLQQQNKGGGDYSIGVFAGGTSDVTSVAQAANSFITVKNVEFIKVGQAIYVNGSDTQLSTKWTIQNNTIGGTTDSEKPHVGVNLSNVKDYEVSGNNFLGIIRDVNQATTSKHAGVYIEGKSNGIIFKNNIKNVTNTQADGTPESRGIYINADNNFIYNNYIENVSEAASWSFSSGIYVNGSSNTIYNNIISNFSTAYSNAFYGIYLKTGASNRIYFNTVAITNGSGSGSSCLFIDGGTTLEIKDNIFYNSQSSGSQYAIYSNSNNSVFSSIDYNDYYATTIGYLGGNQNSLANWKTATGNKDTNSNDKAPVFKTSTDFRLENTAANVTNLKKGTPNPTITTTDIENDPRSTTTPYMGADEIYVCVKPDAAGAITGATAVCQGQLNVPYSVPLITNATSYTWSYSGIGATITNQTTNTPTITFADNATSGDLTVFGVNSCGNGTISANYSITVNPHATPTFITTPQAQSCAGEHITYETQSGKSNYVWSVSGVLNTDYNIIDKGTSTNNTIVIAWLTAGPKTVNVNYNTPSGCSAVLPATYSTEVLLANKGQVHGGRNICLGEDSPELYIANYSGTIIKWQYSDDPLEAEISWKDIPDTGNKVTYQPEKLTALRTFRVVVQNGICSVKTAIPTRIDIDIQPTFTVSPSATSCPNVDVTYTTQSGQRDYIWTIPGIAGTDYTITSGGITLSNNSVTLKWLTAGSKTVTVTYTNACSNNPVASSTTTVNEYTVSGPSLHLPVCINTQMSPITHTLKGFNGIGTGSFNLPSGLTVSYDSTTKLLTISGTPTSLGTFNYTIPLTTTTGCVVSGAATGTITVNALPATPTATLTSSPTCANPTASISITGLSGSWTLYRNSVQVATGTGTSYTDTGLTGGTAYTYQVSNASCTSEATTAITPTAVPTTKYTSGSWDNGEPGNDPTNLKNVIFEGDYIAENDINACSCTVNSGDVIIKGGKTLNITNALTVNGGTLTFNNDASLLQTNPTALNSGAINYQRKSVDIRLADYVYWSSPVENFKVGLVSPLTNAKYLYSNNGTNWVNESKTNPMLQGKGYIIRGPDNITNNERYPFEATFTGKPNNGNINGESVKKDQFYLVGNPYPSALDADEFLGRNRAILEGTLYFWTHNTPVVLGGAYEYSSDDYATYNLSGGAGTAAAASGDDDDDVDNGQDNLNNENVPSGFIGAGQSFFVGIAANGQIKFDNDMRAGGNTNGQFFKPGKTDKTTALEKHRVWLNMTNAKGAFKQILVGYIQGASNDYEKFYDGTTLDGNKYVDFYSVNDGNNLVIQGRALPFADSDIVPLGYRSTLVGDFTIAIDHADGKMNTQAIYLEDKTTGKIQDLTAANYTFTTEKGTFNDRFVLRYTNKTLGTGDFENVENGLLVSVKDKVIKVTSAKESIKEVIIFDITGKQLYTKTKIGATEFEISNLQSANQVLLVKVILENGFTITKKIIFQ